MKITIEEAKTKKMKPQAGTPLGFGKYFTDHMFVREWTIEDGWKDGKIVPYGPIEMDPASMVLHYEGISCKRWKNFIVSPGDECAPFYQFQPSHLHE